MPQTPKELQGPLYAVLFLNGVGGIYFQYRVSFNLSPVWEKWCKGSWGFNLNILYKCLYFTSEFKNYHVQDDQTLFFAQKHPRKTV